MARILIVDDEPKVCRQLELFFKAKGYEVTTTTSGEDALYRVKSDRPHLILLDIRMPGLDGIEVLRRAKALDPALGVIMITAVRDEEVAQRTLQEGAFDYITKPLDLDYLETSVMVKVINLLGKKASPAEPKGSHGRVTPVS